MQPATSIHWRPRRISTALAFLTASLICAPLSAEEISASQIAFPEITPTQYNPTVTQVPAPNGDSTSLGFNFTGTTLAETSSALDEGSDWYLVNAGDLFSTAAISANQFPIIYTTTTAHPCP